MKYEITAQDLRCSRAQLRSRPLFAYQLNQRWARKNAAGQSTSPGATIALSDATRKCWAGTHFTILDHAQAWSAQTLH